MGQEHEPFNGRPVQNCAIVCSGKASLLGGDDIDGRHSIVEAADDVVIEILVGREADQRLRRAWSRTRVPSRGNCFLIRSSTSRLAFSWPARYRSNSGWCRG